MYNFLIGTAGFYILMITFLAGFFMARLYYRKYTITQLQKKIEQYEWRLKRSNDAIKDDSLVKIVNIESHNHHRKANY